MTDPVAIASLAVSLGALGITFYYSHKGFRQTQKALEQNSKATQLQVFESIFREIRALDAEYIDMKHSQQKPGERWCFLFFNVIEYLAYMINHGMVRYDDLYEFYRPSIQAWYRTFTESANPVCLNDPEFCPEFRKLHLRAVAGSIQ